MECEAQQIAQRQGNDNVAQERVTHERAYVGNASQWIGEIDLQAVAELI